MSIHRRDMMLGSVLALAGVALPASSNAHAAVNSRPDLQEIEVVLIARLENEHNAITTESFVATDHATCAFSKFGH